MGALPKRKISKGRKNRRRSQDGLTKPKITPCPKCGKAKRPHFQCEFCGHYGGKPASANKTATKVKTKSKTKPAEDKTKSKSQK